MSSSSFGWEPVTALCAVDSSQRSGIRRASKVGWRKSRNDASNYLSVFESLQRASRCRCRRQCDSISKRKRRSRCNEPSLSASTLGFCLLASGKTRQLDTQGTNAKGSLQGDIHESCNPSINTLDW